MYLSKRNGIYYIYFVNIYGKRNGISTGTRYKNEALKFLSDFRKEYELKSKRHITPINLYPFIFEYLKHSEMIHAPNTTKSIRSTTNKLKEYFGNIKLTDLSDDRLRKYLILRIHCTSNYVGRRELNYISGMLKFAIQRKYLKENYTKTIPRIKIPEKQPLYFSEIEFKILLKTVDIPDIKDLIIFAANTGCRQMELLTLEWNQINFQDKFLILDNRKHKTKTGKVRSIPLNIKALQILIERQANSKTNFVFTRNDCHILQDYISKKFKKYVIKAGLNPKLNFHSLRHSFATWLIQKGASIYQVSKLLGHSNLSTTEIYLHTSTADLRSSVALLEGR